LKQKKNKESSQLSERRLHRPRRISSASFYSFCFLKQEDKINNNSLKYLNQAVNSFLGSSKKCLASLLTSEKDLRSAEISEIAFQESKIFRTPISDKKILLEKLKIGKNNYLIHFRYKQPQHFYKTTSVRRIVYR